MAKPGPKRQRGTIRRRGGSFQVVVYAGQDPVTGKRRYLTDSTTDAREAERVRRKFVAQVDEQRNVPHPGDARRSAGVVAANPTRPRCRRGWRRRAG